MRPDLLLMALASFGIISRTNGLNESLEALKKLGSFMKPKLKFPNILEQQEAQIQQLRNLDPAPLRQATKDIAKFAGAPSGQGEVLTKNSQDESLEARKVFESFLKPKFEFSVPPQLGKEAAKSIKPLHKQDYNLEAVPTLPPAPTPVPTAGLLLLLMFFV